MAGIRCSIGYEGDVPSAPTSTISLAPNAKRQELTRMVSILFDEFGRALAGRKTPHAKSTRILKVVLFGSYELSPWLPRAR